MAVVLRLLKRRLGDLTGEQQGQIERLSADDLGTLGEALLDFAGPRTWTAGCVAIAAANGTQCAGRV